MRGPANSARVWTFWQDELARRGWASHTIGLCGHVVSAAADLGATRMADYAAATATGDTLWPRHRYDALPLAANHVSIDGASTADWS